MKSTRRRLDRLLLRLKYLLWQHRRHNRLVLERAAGLDLVLLPGVMNPRLFRSGEYFATTLNKALIPEGSHVLDMGTGSGIVAISAARWAGHVDAVDVNSEAVRCARINALLNGFEAVIEVHEGDLFEPLCDRRYDVVLFNPPFFRGAPGGGFDLAWRANDTVERFAAELGNHLRPSGYALVIFSTDGDTQAFLDCFTRVGYRRQPVASNEMPAETFTVYRFIPAE